VCVSGGGKSRACPGTKMHHYSPTQFIKHWLSPTACRRRVGERVGERVREETRRFSSARSPLTCLTASRRGTHVDGRAIAILYVL